ncbi:hypothetical protein NC652_035023 [Populus alba x Populus x berolinensis]|nr:hypothetical protein NC652_035023 [Populus alba x Populus x berolinensis]
MIKLVLCYLPCFWVSPFALFCCDLCPLFVFQPSPPLLISPCFPLCSGFLFSGFCFFLRLPSHALSFFCSWLCFGLIFSCAGMKMKARLISDSFLLFSPSLCVFFLCLCSVLLCLFPLLFLVPSVRCSSFL